MGMYVIIIIYQGLKRGQKYKMPSYRSNPRSQHSPGSLLTNCTYLLPVRLTDLIYGSKIYPRQQHRKKDGLVRQRDSLGLALPACAPKCDVLNYCLTLSLCLCLCVSVTSALILSQLTNHQKTQWYSQGKWIEGSRQNPGEGQVTCSPGTLILCTHGIPQH